MSDMDKGIAIGAIIMLATQAGFLIFMIALSWAQDKYREHRMAKWQNRKIQKEETNDGTGHRQKVFDIGCKSRKATDRR